MTPSTQRIFRYREFSSYTLKWQYLRTVILFRFSSLNLLNTVAETWLMQTEATIPLKGVTVSSNKFYYCVSRNCKSSSGSHQITSGSWTIWGSEEAVAQTFCTWWLPEVWSHFQSATLRIFKTFQAHVKYVSTPPRWSQTLFLTPWSFSQGS